MCGLWLRETQNTDKLLYLKVKPQETKIKEPNLRLCVFVCFQEFTPLVSVPRQLLALVRCRQVDLYVCEMSERLFPSEIKKS
jgi:hypothetical protein